MRCVTCEKGQLDCRVKVVDGRYKGACGICKGNKKACSLTDTPFVKSGDATATTKTGPPKRTQPKRATRARVMEHPDNSDEGLEDRLKEMEGT